MQRFFAVTVTAMLVFVAPALAAEPPAGLIMHDAPKELPDVGFQDGDGQDVSLSGFRGKVLLVNVWATWCPPCRHEMPTLDRLQGELGGPGFEVIALSIDRSGPEKVREFFTEIDVNNLALYIDPSGKAAHKLEVIGLPATLLIDTQRLELGRLVGPAEWDTPERVEFFKGVIARQSGGLDVEIRARFARLSMHDLQVGNSRLRLARRQTGRRRQPSKRRTRVKATSGKET
jgi:thiol-disulfide isomerase/thioredoxin